MCYASLHAYCVRVSVGAFCFPLLRDRFLARAMCIAQSTVARRLLKTFTFADSRGVLSRWHEDNFFFLLFT